MNKYQTKKLDVEAIQFNGSNQNEIMDFFDGHCGKEGVSFLMDDTIHLVDDTGVHNEGIHIGKVGDYVVKIKEGEYYLYEEEIFNLTFGLNKE